MENKPVKFASKYDVEFSFRLRRHSAGSFKNLWSFEVKRPKDKEFVEIVDADSLTTLLDRIGYVFEEEGF